MIPVGDSGEVELIFHSRANQRGRVRKSARVTVNDNSQDNFLLRLNGELYQHNQSDSLKPLALSDPMIHFQPNERGDKKELTVTNVSDQELSISLVSAAPAFFEVDLPGNVKPGESEEIKVKLLKHVEGDRFEKSFTIEMNDAEKTRVTIPVVLASEIPMRTPRPAQKPPQIKQPAKRPDTTSTKASTSAGSSGG